MRLTLFPLLLVAACGGPPSSSAPPPTPDSTKAPITSPVLQLVEMTFQSSEGLAHLDGKGRLEVDGNEVLTLFADGRAVDGKGAPLTRMQADGTFGNKGLRIEEDGTMRAPDGEAIMTLAEDGMVRFKGKTMMRVTPADPKTRRTAMFAILLMQASSGGATPDF